MLILKLSYPKILDFCQTIVVMINTMGCLIGVFMDSVSITVSDEIMKTLNYTIKSEHKFGVFYACQKAGLRQFAKGKNLTNSKTKSLNFCNNFFTLVYQRFAQGQSEGFLRFLMTCVVIIHVFVVECFECCTFTFSHAKCGSMLQFNCCI